MRVVRLRWGSTTSYGILHDDGQTVGLTFDAPYEDAGRALTGETVQLSECALLAPVEPTKILAVGRNFAAHAAEMGLALGGPPSVFIKPLQTIIAEGGEVVLPSSSTKIEHEGEVAVVIGRKARYVTKADAGDYVFGFTCADDVSARDFQKGDPQITRGKGFDTFCPLGPWIETDVSITEERELTCRVNGELRQSGSTRDLIYDIPTMIEWLSSWTTLLPGDVVLMGSPGGTGPLVPGDRVEVSVEGVGVLTHTCVAVPPRSS
jgi:2-keto-4-pentenoate hydratase/2-oxohepta-3-ene-1,7-dioic acid hydratase in catechol pathway